MTLRQWANRQITRLALDRPNVSRAVLLELGSPTLFELSQTANSWHTSADTLVDLLFPSQGADELVHRGRGLAAEMLATRPPSRYPKHFTVRTETAALIYTMVRLIRPTMMVETGVADGLSTALTLAAMGENGHGNLHSIEIANDVGALVTDRTRWTLHITFENNPAATARLIRSFAPIDVFLHDGDHRYPQQSVEYATAWAALRPGGWLVSDDVDYSYAFRERMITDPEFQGNLLLDTRKVSGAARRPDHPVERPQTCARG
jgi:predicted O-methyltransferase YrrM